MSDYSGYSRTDLEAMLDLAKDEIRDLRASVIAFCGPWAVEYAKLHGLDGLHPKHFDLLERCGARMADFKRADMPTEPVS